MVVFVMWLCMAARCFILPFASPILMWLFFLPLVAEKKQGSGGGNGTQWRGRFGGKKNKNAAMDPYDRRQRESTNGWGMTKRD
jgi:hypothetical protein